KYQKFDPNDPEAVIAFDIMFSAYKDQSLNFAKYVEDEFVRNGRSSRGVKQANFHVLRTNASPAVLVELGFISNQDEGSYLATEQGKQKMTQSLFEAFEKFKKEFDRKTRPQEDEKPKEV